MDALIYGPTCFLVFDHPQDIGEVLLLKVHNADGQVLGDQGLKGLPDSVAPLEGPVYPLKSLYAIKSAHCSGTQSSHPLASILTRHPNNDGLSCWSIS